MTAAMDEPPASGRIQLVDELSEDLDVAVREFLERHPGTSPNRIRTAMRLAERRTRGGRLQRVAPVLALITAFVIGLMFGFVLG